MWPQGSFFFATKTNIARYTGTTVTGAILYKPLYFTQINVYTSPHPWWFANIHFTGGNGTTTASAPATIGDCHDHMSWPSINSSTNNFKWDGVNRKITIDYFDDYDEEDEDFDMYVKLSPTSVTASYGMDYIHVTGIAYCEKYYGGQLVGHGTTGNYQQEWGGDCSGCTEGDSTTLNVSSLQTSKTESATYYQWKAV